MMIGEGGSESIKYLNVRHDRMTRDRPPTLTLPTIYAYFPRGSRSFSSCLNR